MIREIAFKMICRRHADEIYRYVRSLLGNAVDAEDAVQEVLLRFWQNLPSVPLLEARAWLYRTSRNYCLDQLRRRSQSPSPVFPGASALEDVMDGGAQDFSRAAQLDDLRASVDAALQHLPDTLRSVFILYEVNGLRCREIARQLDLPINSVKVHLLRARKKLQELLRKEKAWMNS